MFGEETTDWQCLCENTSRSPLVRSDNYFLSFCTCNPTLDQACWCRLKTRYLSLPTGYEVSRLQGEQMQPSHNIVNIGVSRCQNWGPLPLPLSSAGWLTSVLSPAPASINNPGYSRSSHCPHQHRHIWSSINIPTNHNTSEILRRNHEECHPLLATEGDQKKETIMHNA